jgi:benzoate-CoA ligase
MEHPAALPTHFNFAQYLIGANHSRSEKIAYLDDVGALTYGALSRRICAFSAAICAAGIRREERVFLLMHDCNDWPVAFLGALHAGVVPVAVNTLLTADDYAYMLQHARAKAVIVSAALLPIVQVALQQSGHEVGRVIVSRPTTALPAGYDEFEAFLKSGSLPLGGRVEERAVTLPNEIASKSNHPHPSPLPQGEGVNTAANTHADDPAFWLYSSGSTGRPKGTVHTHANLFWTGKLYGQDVLNISEKDVCFSAAKLFFAYGLGNGLSFPLMAGATTILMAERPTPDVVFKRWTGGISNTKPTIFFGAPTGYAGMLAAPNLPAKNQLALRMASSAGEALPEELGKKFTAHYGVEIVDGIGSTEMLHIYLSNVPGNVRYGTTGWPVAGYEIALRGEAGEAVPDGEPGDLYIKGPSAALMYWSNREKSRETFQGAWTKSGDKYVKNADGTYTYSGRSDDMLKVSGIYVSPFEVESTLMQHAAVLEAAVIGVEDDQGLTKTKAFVVLKAGQAATEEQLKAFVKDRLAPYKYPRTIEFINELPKTATGKIQRFKLREREKK